MKANDIQTYSAPCAIESFFSYEGEDYAVQYTVYGVKISTDDDGFSKILNGTEGIEVTEILRDDGESVNESDYEDVEEAFYGYILSHPEDIIDGVESTQG
jgi:hypothetical protein